jgi:N utilization substance protein A
MDVKLDEGAKIAEVSVAPDQFSLAIGRSGQNVRLAAQLTGWKINVVEAGGTQQVSSEEEIAEPTVETAAALEEAVAAPEEAPAEIKEEVPGGDKPANE